MAEAGALPPHLRCRDEGGLKPVFHDFRAEEEFYRSYPLADVLAKEFPGILLKHPPFSVNWSRLSQPEDCWHYRPQQGVARFGCDVPQKCYDATSGYFGGTLGRVELRLIHEPECDDPENYAHCVIRFFLDGKEATSQEELQKMVPIEVRKHFRQSFAACVAYRHTPADPWQFRG